MSTDYLVSAEEIGAETVSPLVSVRHVALPANVTECCFSRDGTLCAAAMGDGAIALVDLHDTESTAPALQDLHRVAAVAIKPLDDGFVSAGQDGRAVLFGAAGASPTEICDLGDHWIESLAVHQDTGHIAVAAGNQVSVFDRHANTLARFPEAPGTISDVAFDASGSRVAASHYNGATVFNLKSGASEMALEWQGAHIGVSWSPNGRYLVTATQEKELHIWDLVTLQDFRMGGYPRKIHQMSWTCDGDVMGCSGADVITAWSFAGAGPGRRPPVEIGFVFGGTVTSVCAHPTGPLFAGGYSSGNVLIGATRKGEAVMARARTGTPVTSLGWSPDGSCLAAADGAGRLSLFTVPNNLEIT